MTGKITIQIPKFLTNVPLEIWALIFDFLSTNADLKNIRLANKYFADVILLRIDRVFLSPNPRNIEVFRAIADHEIYRHKILGIIYDDARLPRSQNDSMTPKAIINHKTGVSSNGWSSSDGPKESEEEPPTSWWQMALVRNKEDFTTRMGVDVPRPWHTEAERKYQAAMGIEESMAYYLQLLKQQDEVMVANADYEALVYGLARFSSLRSVTITPAAHGFLYTPLYQTPMIRQFPVGFNYPVPRGWPNDQETWPYGSRSDGGWVPESPDRWFPSGSLVRARWRGYRLVTKALAENLDRHSISELRVDAHWIPTELNCSMFQQPCEDYDNFAKIIKQSGFQSLQLDLLIGAQSIHDWPALRSGLLGRAFSDAKDMTSLRFSTDQDHGLYDEEFPLLEVFHHDCLARLEHFGLNNVPVTEQSLMDLLLLLPESLKTLELGFLEFIRSGEGYHNLLTRMRDELGWGARHPPPSVTTVTENCTHHWKIGRGHWINEEINEFLYSEGLNPFISNISDGDVPCHRGYGTLRDVFDATYERPWLTHEEYQERGIFRPPPNSCLD